MEILRKTDKLILDMKTNDSLRKTILKNAKDNRIFMSWLIFEASTWTNYGFVLLYLEEAIRLRSMWMMIVSMYYGSIALLRTHWSHFTKMINTLTNEVEKKQLRINGVRSVGLMLVGLNLIFGIFVSLVTHGEGSFQYSKGVFYLMILYVGFGFWASLTNAIRDRGIGMMWNSLRMINLSAAITGVFILIAGFYDNYILEMSTRNLVLSITGTFSFMILLLLTVHTLLLSGGEEK